MHRAPWHFRIRHILEAIDQVDAFIDSMSFDIFCADIKTQYAVVYAFAIIGEAARHVPGVVQAKYADIPWNAMKRMRNVMVHDYERIDPKILWETARVDLPPLRSKLAQLLSETSES